MIVSLSSVELLLLEGLPEHPHLVPAVGEFEGAVVAGRVERLIHELHAVPLQALQQLQQLVSLHRIVGETTVGPGNTRHDARWIKAFHVNPHRPAGCLPDVGGELLPVLHKHLGVARLGRLGLKFVWDVEGNGELRLAVWAGSRVHAARHGRGHLHFGL